MKMQPSFQPEIQPEKPTKAPFSVPSFRLEGIIPHNFGIDQIHLGRQKPFAASF
jgi:hypothetical protein